jgi:hypothetical protein
VEADRYFERCGNPMKPNIAERIAEIRKMLAAATPGPWECVETDEGHEIRMGAAIESPGHYDSHHVIEYDHNCFYEDDEDETDPGNAQALEAEANAVLIAKSHETTEFLLGEVERQAEEIERLQGLYKRTEDQLGVEIKTSAYLRTEIENLKGALVAREALKEGE